MNREEALYKRLKNEDWTYMCAQDKQLIMSTIKQTLSQPTKETLRKSIIERLNEMPYYKLYKNYKWKYVYDEKNEIHYFMQKDEKTDNVIRYLTYASNELDFRGMFLPLQLAHDICEYFIRIGDEKR